MNNETYFQLPRKSIATGDELSFSYSKVKDAKIDKIAEVEIYNTINISSLITSYTEYRIKAKIINSKGEDQEFEVARRFSDFYQMHKILRNIPGLILPYFPEKNYIDKMEPYVINTRRNYFEAYLKKMAKSDLLFVNRLICMFLSLAPEEFKHFKNKLPSYNLVLPSTTTNLLSSMLNSTPKINCGGYISLSKKVAQSIVLRNGGNEFVLGEEKEFKMSSKELFGNGEDFYEAEQTQRALFAEPEMSDVYISNIHDAINVIEEAFDQLLQKNELIILSDNNPLFNRQNLKEKVVAFFGITTTDKIAREIPKMIGRLEGEKEKLMLMENAAIKMKKMIGTLKVDSMEVGSKEYKDAIKKENISRYERIKSTTGKLMAFFEAQQDTLHTIAESYEEVKEDLYFFYNEMLELPRLNQQFLNYDILINKAAELSAKYQTELYNAKTLVTKRKLEALIESLKEVTIALKIQKGSFLVNFEKGYKEFKTKREKFIQDVLGKFKNKQKDVFSNWKERIKYGDTMLLGDGYKKQRREELRADEKTEERNYVDMATAE